MPRILTSDEFEHRGGHLPLDGPVTDRGLAERPVRHVTVT